MDSEIHFPLSLVTRMNDDASIEDLRAWRLSRSGDMLGDTCDIHALYYDKQRAQFVDKMESSELRGVIESYKRKNQADKFWANFTPEAFTWQQVYDELQRSESEYRQKGAVNRFRRAVRGGFLPNVAPLVEAIPEDDGLGLLKGGIIVLINAVKRRSQACDKIFDCFSKVPELIKQAQDTLRRFAKDQDSELRSCANHLYSVLLECLPPLIDIILRQSDEPNLEFIQYGRGIFVDEVSEIDKLLQPLTVAKRALEQRTARLNDKRHDNTGRKMDAIAREIPLIRQNQHQHQHELKRSLDSIDHSAARIHHQTGRIESKVEGVLNNQTAFISLVSEQNAHVNRIHEENAALKKKVMQLEMLNAFHVLAEEKWRNQRFCKEGEHRPYFPFLNRLTDSIEAPNHNRQCLEGPSLQLSNAAMILDLDQLLTFLCDPIETRSHATNLYSVLEQYHLFSDKALAHAAHLSERPEFRDWLLLKGSGSLLVDGHCGGHMTQRISPLSVFCATLVQSLLDMSLNSQDMVLYFFCGQHFDPNGPLPGPQGLLRSLTVQIILGLGSKGIVPSLEFLGRLPGLAQNTYPMDIDIQTIGQILIGLLSQLPFGTTVHCVVEDVSQFETTLDGWAEQMRIVVDCLQSCVFNSRFPVFLKPLYTSAEASTVVYDDVPWDQRIDLRSGDYYGSVSSSRALMMDLSNQLSNSVPWAEEQSGGEHIRIKHEDSSASFTSHDRTSLG